MTHTGCFITLEGIDGAGKSTHIPWIADQLRGRGIDVVVTREPGGTPLGETLRACLLDPATEVSLKTETLLMFAARQQHLDSVIIPALARGAWVLCDRFTDATFAYQGGGRELGAARIEALEQWVQEGLQPDLTLLFDLDPEQAEQRRLGAREPDRFEQEARAFHQRVRRAYLSRAASAPARFRLLNASQTIAALQQEIHHALEGLVGC